MIYDCFLFNGEFDALAIRVEELRGVVDKHCIFEADRTFQGGYKPWHTLDERFDAIMQCSSFEVFPLHVPVANPWERERQCRDAMAYRCGAEEDDLVLVSDADEIVRADDLRGAVAVGRPCAFDLRNFYYLLDWELPQSEMALPILAEASMFRRTSATDLRQRARSFETIYRDAGWHFSFLGFTPEQIVEKLNSFAHSELRDTLTPKLAERCIRVGLDCVLDRDFTLGPVDIDESYPKFVRDDFHPTRLTRKGWS